MKLLFAIGSHYQPGHGPRVDCARADACAAAWLREANAAHTDDRAHCPPGCMWWQAPRDGRAALDEFATARRST